MVLSEMLVERSGQWRDIKKTETDEFHADTHKLHAPRHATPVMVKKEEWPGTYHKGAFHVVGIFAKYVEPLQFGLQEKDNPIFL